jgi:hypothetical protein
MVRLVQHYAPILNERILRGIRHPNDPDSPAPQKLGLSITNIDGTLLHRLFLNV